ncbi:MAG: VWA domain-containing protein [Methylomarinum sp.]|nr:VWA domain-containing protein [Methylomarinum sp.]
MELAEFHFIRPYWLLALIPAIVITVLLVKNKLNQGNWATVCDAELLPFILQEKAVTHSRWTLSIGSIASLLVIFALAGPTWERLPSPVFRNDAALVIALDLSQSMNSTDIKPSRLSRARFKIADILKQRKDGQTALLVYAGDAFTVTPLTEDTETIISQLSALTTEIMPSQGSNTVLALQKAVELLKQSGLQSGEILLVTDEVNYDQSVEAVESLAAYHLSILGVGTADGAPIKIGRGGFLKDAEGNIVLPKLNSQELAQLAQKGKGRYITIQDDDRDIEKLLSQFDNPTEKQQSADNNLLIEQWNEKGPWLLLLALPLVALQFRKGLLSLALICLLPFPEPSYALEWKDLWQTQDQQAQQAFNSGNYQQAAKQFDSDGWKAAAEYKAGQFEKTTEILNQDESAKGLYNKGNALAQSGKLAESIEAYKKSLEKNPANEDAKYNQQLVEKELEKQKQSEKDKQQGEDKEKSEQQDGEKQEQDQQGDPSDESGDQDKQQDSDSEPKPSDKNESEEQSDAEQSEADKSEEEKNAEEKQAQQAAPPEQYDESKQADEQWLNSIPDDPAGLLKRKFKYQYGQRGRKETNGQSW